MFRRQFLFLWSQVIIMNSDRTKNLFADALLELTNRKPLSDISISDIVAHCSTSRNTFYYHFKDKQELIFWIYSNFHDAKINLSGNPQSNSMELLKYMQQYASFFKQAFAEGGQNCFKSEFIKSMAKDYDYIINTHYNTAAIDDASKDFVSKFFANASVSALELIFNCPPEDTQHLVDTYTVILDDTLAKTLRKLNHRKEHPQQ